MICPQCGNTYPDDDLFCPVDGNTLITGDDEQETAVNKKVPFAAGGAAGGFQAGESASPAGGRVYDETVTFRPPLATPQRQPVASSSSSKNLLMAVIGGCVVIIAMLAYLLASRTSNTDSGKETAAATRSPTPSPSASPSSTVNANTKGMAVNTDPGASGPPPTPRPLSLPDGVERAYSGTSYVPGGSLPLTLSLKRNGSSLTGSARTPGDEDRLSGVIQPDGSFDLEGYNYLASRVTGNWRGRIDENGVINGTWTSTAGKRIRFYAR